MIRPVIDGLLDKLGIGSELLTRGSHADLLAFSRPLDSADRDRLREEIGSLYDLFLERVAAGRGMTTSEVDEAGRGRVWTGQQALDLGLVDELGGLRAAVRRAKELAGIDVDTDVSLVPYPAPRPLAEQLAEAFWGSRAEALPELSLLGALGRLRAWVTLLPPGRPVLVPPFFVEIH